MCVTGVIEPFGMTYVFRAVLCMGLLTVTGLSSKAIIHTRHFNETVHP